MNSALGILARPGSFQSVASERNSTETGPVGKLAWPAFILFAASYALEVLKLLAPARFDENHWPEAVLLVTTAASVIVVSSRVQPFQNILWGAIVIGVLGGLAHAVGVLAGIPFGNFVFTPAAGPRVGGILPWSIPLLWIVVIYSSRGMARVILSRWRSTPFYGCWMMGLTVALACILDLGLDPFASGAQRFWIWGPTRLSVSWHGTPLTNYIGWGASTIVIVVFVTPMLINKKPAPPPSESHSAWIWILLNGWFILSAVVRGQWTLAVGIAAPTLIAAGIAARKGLLP